MNFKEIQIELFFYFYFNQYKYDHYRSCDLEYEFDEEGNKYPYFIFY